MKFVLLLGVLMFLFSFGKNRNEKRKLTKVEIEFVDGKEPFITHKTVNKLLIQKEVELTGIGKEGLVLKEMEKRLQENPMIREAEVFVTIDGILGAKIVQRDPIGRVATQRSGPDYYLDADGKKMPLSQVYSARVPIVTGITEGDGESLTPLLLKIREDEFMQSMVVGLNKSSSGEIEMELRKSDIKILFGPPTHIDRKFQNFKAFYKKTKQDSTLFGYDKINLKFENQVIATKKEGYGKR